MHHFIQVYEEGKALHCTLTVCLCLGQSQTKRRKRRAILHRIPCVVKNETVAGRFLSRQHSKTGRSPPDVWIDTCFCVYLYSQPLPIWASPAEEFWSF
jgi:hypothetical protein